MKRPAQPKARDRSADLSRLGAMASTPDPLVLTLGDQRVIWANDAAGRLFGLSTEALSALTMKELLALPPSAVVEACRSVTTRGYLSGGIDIVTGDGRNLPVRFRAFALGDDALHLVAFRSAPGQEEPFRDRTAPASARLPVSAEIAAAIGHEIRTPLATALLYMGIAQKAIGDGAHSGPAKTALATARDEISRIERLVTRVTEMQGFGFPVMRPRLVDLRRVISESVQRSVMGAGARLVHLEIGRGNLVDWWDDGAVEQIVTNLLSNALKFGEGRPVEVSVARSADTARVSVKDRGIGIRESDQASLFERRPRSPLSRLPGMGLGLWFVRTLTEAHRGAVAVRSRPGDGATFIITLRPFRN